MSFYRVLLRSNRDVAGVVRRGDFQLMGFEDYHWHLMDYLQGLLLLTRDRCMAVFDPISGSRLSIPHPHYISKSPFHHRSLSSCGGDATSFRVLCLKSMRSGRVRLHVYNSSTGQ
jgi:hypothetical protein